jgi:hypothetical protein
MPPHLILKLVVIVHQLMVVVVLDYIHQSSTDAVQFQRVLYHHHHDEQLWLMMMNDQLDPHLMRDHRWTMLRHQLLQQHWLG